MKFFPYGKKERTIAIIGQYQSFLFSMSNESRPSASPQGKATLKGLSNTSLNLPDSIIPFSRKGKSTLKGGWAG